MRILVLNGSPRKAKSSSFLLTSVFLEGVCEQLAAQNETAEIETLHVPDLQVTPCKGCLSCWGRTAGQCVIRGDDVAGVIERIMAADVIVESFPLHFCGLPGPFKTLMDRLLPLEKTYLGGNLREGQALHGLRYDMSGKRLVLISTCGYGEIDPMYDAVRTQFDHICGRGKYTALFCSQGEAFRAPGEVRRVKLRLEQVRRAGLEFAANGSLCEETVSRIAAPMFSQKIFETLLDTVFIKGGGKDAADTQL